MLNKPTLWVRCALFSGAIIAGSAFANDIKELNFGIISTESSQNLKTMWEPFLADMSKETGYKVNAFFASDYAGIIQGMRFDKVDVAWYGNKSAMEAVDRAGGEVIYQTIDASGNGGYWSLLVAQKDSPINNIDELLANAKDLTFGNGDPNSTSGYLVPSYYVFAQNGVDANKIFKRTVHGSHEINALSVANKQVDVATFNTEAMERLEITHPDKAKEIKEIWRSPLIPSDPIVWRKNLPDEAKEKIDRFFANYGSDEKQEEILKNLQWSKFKKSSDDQLLPIRQLELFRTRSQIESDEKLTSAEKSEKMNAINKKLAELEEKMK